MKNDMRITYPLWQLGAIAILMGIVLLTSYSADFTIYSHGGFEFAISFERGLGIAWGVISLIFVVYLVLFIWSVIKHNKRIPQHKMQIFSWKPQEYMEDDELFQEFTKRATKKVYSYFVWSIPLLASLCIAFSVERTWVLMGLLLLSMGQYVIYYTEIRKYMGVDE